MFYQVDSLKLSNATVPSTPKQKVKQAHQALRVANSNLLSAMSEYNEVDRQHNVSKIALARALRKNRTKPEWDGSRPISSIVNQNSDVPVNTTVDPDAAAEDLEKKKEAVEKSSDELIKANAALKATERPLPSGILDSAANVCFTFPISMVVSLTIWCLAVEHINRHGTNTQCQTSSCFCKLRQS